MTGRANSRSPRPLGASEPTSHSRRPIRYRPSSPRSSAPHATSSAARRYTVGRGSPARRANSLRVNAGVAGLNASSSARTLLVTDRPGSARTPSSSPPAPRAHSSSTSRGVRARETQIIMVSPAARSCSVSKLSRCSGTPASTGVSQVPQVPSRQDERTCTPASSTA